MERLEAWLDQIDLRHQPGAIALPLSAPTVAEVIAAIELLTPDAQQQLHGRLHETQKRMECEIMAYQLELERISKEIKQNRSRLKASLAYQRSNA